MVKRLRTKVARLKPPQPARPPQIPAGWQTGPPDFVGIGVQRAGTSRWFQLMSAHPSVCIPPDAQKEIHFFDRLGPEFGDTQDLAERYARHFPRRAGALTGEWTPCYLASFWTIPMLRRAAPEARLLVILRDPIDRYASGVARLHRTARETGIPLRPSDFADAAGRSLYAAQLEHLFAEFPRQQVLLLQYERCSLDPEAELERTWSFLGLDPAPVPGELLSARLNRAGSHPQLTGEVRDGLARHLAADVKRLPELAPEIDLSLWTRWSDAVASLG